MLNNSDLSYYIAKDALKVINDFPDYNVRYFFPKQVIPNGNRKDRINVLVVQELVHRIWLG